MYKSNHNKKKGRRHSYTFYNNEYPIILSNIETISIFSKRNRKEFCQIEICRDYKNKSDIEIKRINTLATNSGKKSNDKRIYIIWRIKNFCIMATQYSSRSTFFFCKIGYKIRFCLLRNNELCLSINLYDIIYKNKWLSVLIIWEVYLLQWVCQIFFLETR